MALRLYELRTVRGFTQKQVAEKIGITTQTYSSWEQGITKPRAEGIRKLANLYQVSSDFVCGKDFSEVEVEMLLFKVYLLKIFSCPKQCGVPLETISFIEGETYGVGVHCPTCKKGRFHSNDPKVVEEFTGIKKKEAAMCANT